MWNKIWRCWSVPNPNYDDADFMVGRTSSERLPLEHGGRVIVVSQEFPHLKIFIRLSLFVLGSCITSQQPLVLGCVERYPLPVCVCVYTLLIIEFTSNSLSSIQFCHTQHAFLPPAIIFFLKFHFGICSSSFQQIKIKNQTQTRDFNRWTNHLLLPFAAPEWKPVDLPVWL